MLRALPALTAVAALAVASATAGPAAADIRHLNYAPADRLTRSLTGPLTLEVERGLFGAVSVRRLFPSGARGSAGIEPGGPDIVRRALPEGSGESQIYAVPREGLGRGLTRALCPGAEEAWLVLGRVRAGRPLTMHGVGRWADGAVRHCAELNYAYRGQWATPPRGVGSAPERPAPPLRG